MKFNFITGMPRSGTTWLANFFTQGRVFCYHEALVGCPNMAEYASKLQQVDADVVMDSDSGLIHYLKPLRATFPDSLVVVINRNAFEVMSAMQEAGCPMTTKAFSTMFERHKEALLDADIIVPFEGLFGEATLRSLWDKLCPEEPFSRPRWEMLTRIKVEPNLEKYLPWYSENIRNAMKVEAA